MTQYHSNEMNNAEICINRRVQLLKYGVKCNTVNHPFHAHPYRFRVPLGEEILQSLSRKIEDFYRNVKNAN